MRLFFLILIFILALQQYHLWFRKNGLQDHYNLEKEVALIKADTDELMQRNQMMFSEIEDLRYEYEEQGIDLKPQGDLMNWYAWFSFEEVARKLASELGIFDE